MYGTVPDVIPSYTGTHSSLAIPIVRIIIQIAAIFAAIIIAAAMVISGIFNTAEIREEMKNRRETAGNEQGVDLARVGKNRVF
jgi:hypothetical protein